MLGLEVSGQMGKGVGPEIVFKLTAYGTYEKKHAKVQVMEI